MLFLFFLLLNGVSIWEVYGGYYFVTGPNVIRFNHDETIVVSVFGLESANVKVWLEHDKKQFSVKTVTVKDQENPVYTSVKVKEEDIIDIEYDIKKPKKVKLCSEWNGRQQKREIILSYHSGYLIIQTDKPIYTPRQKVKIRALALDESLKSCKKCQVGMDIISPLNLTISRKSVLHSSTGFYGNHISLPTYPDLGIWTARTFFMGQFETEARVTFEVREYVVPTFGVTVQVDVEFILQSTQSITVTVKAGYVYGKPVEGNARLKLRLKDEDQNITYILDVDKKQLELRDSIQESVAEFTVDTDDIKNSPLLNEKPFPDGKRLEVIATVYESATGNEEGRRHDAAIFTNNPFMFKFTKSKLYFRPDYNYYLKVEVLNVNGKPANGQNVTVKMFEDGTFKTQRKDVTDDDGRIILTFQTSKNTREISFTVSTSDGQFESKNFEVKAYKGKNHIQVECVISNGGIMEMRAYTNIQGNDTYTGLLFMVISRGKIVNTIYKDPRKEARERIKEDLQELVSPDARLLVFYVDKTSNELVADSVKFEVKKKCRGKGLKLELTNHQAKPRSSEWLTVTGSPSMNVGLNVIDKAVLLLNDRNILKKNKMFEILQSHDLGCGEGSGHSGADVFKKSGLTVLTNADINEDEIVRTTYGCEKKSRKRRDADSCLNGVDLTCCNEGYELAEKLYYANSKRIEPYTSCYQKARILAKENRLSMKCVVAFFMSCVDELEYHLSDQAEVYSKSLVDKSEYLEDIENLERASLTPMFRSDFKESWLFEIYNLTPSGKKRIKLILPDSITKWQVQAVGLTEDQGICIADPVELKAFKEIFVQLELPYKATRLENFNVKATVFNYGKHDGIANVYLEGTDNMCYGSEPGMPSHRVQIKLPSNNAKSISFPMIPLAEGLFDVKVSAIVTIKGFPAFDGIKKKLYVVNEGIQGRRTLILRLDPRGGKEDDDCFTNDKQRVTDDSNIMSNIVTTIIDGVDSMFKEPYGCGEQNMMRLAPTVYALTYLKQTQTLKDDLETKGKQWIKEGVDHQISGYRHYNGAYAIWRWAPPSIWLTAFVAKVFCQARNVVNDAVDEDYDIYNTIDWLVNQADEDGSFYEEKSVYDRAIMGQTNKRDQSLTAFVLITLQECNIKNDDLNTTIWKAIQYLERLPNDVLENNPFLLAISTYALALSDSTEKSRYMELLLEKGKKDCGMYWGNSINGIPGNAHAVETTSYALLAMLQFNFIDKSSSIVRWLTFQRNEKGAFRSTQDTVVGLQALSRYSVLTYSPEVDLKMTFYAHNWHGSSIHLTREHLVVPVIVGNLPVERGNNDLNIKVEGTGSAVMTIDLRYNRLTKQDEICPFNVSNIDVQNIENSNTNKEFVELSIYRNCDVCGYCEGDMSLEANDHDSNNYANSTDEQIEVSSRFGRRKRETNQQSNVEANKKCIRFNVRTKDENESYGMSLVKFGLETGVEVVKDDLQKLVDENDSNIASYEMPSDGKGFIVFYLNGITSRETKFIFRIKDNFDGEVRSRQQSSVSVYDYYNPDKSCTVLYSTAQNKENVGMYKCTEGCTCLNKLCARSVSGEIEHLFNKKRKPVLKLADYACKLEKANYAVRVKIESVNITSNTSDKKVYARGNVSDVYNQGLEHLSKYDEMLFSWNVFCSYPKLEEGKTYVIIAKDGSKIQQNEKKIFEYSLMDTAVVIEFPNKKRSILKMVLTRFGRWMKKYGCYG